MLISDLPSTWRGKANDTRQLAPGDSHPLASLYDEVAFELEEAEQLRVTTPGDEIIHVPHEPEAEAALLQETRERLSHLETRHLVDPEAVASLKSLDEDLEAIMTNMAAHDVYECPEFNVL